MSPHFYYRVSTTFPDNRVEIPRARNGPTRGRDEPQHPTRKKKRLEGPVAPANSYFWLQGFCCLFFVCRILWLSPNHIRKIRASLGLIFTCRALQGTIFLISFSRWDQTLWDSMLPIFDQLQAPHGRPNETVTWGIISPRYVTEWGKDSSMANAPQPYQRFLVIRL